MTTLFFPMEYATTVELDADGMYVIRQFEDSACQHELGNVFLTRHQFEEIYNRKKALEKRDEE